MIGLTFDDGPDAQETQRILDLLAERSVKASFFMLANRAEERPDLARRVVDDGHEACLHGANHDNLTRLGTTDVVDRIRGGKQRLESVIGSRVFLFRPPYGAQNLRSYMTARFSGMKPVLWTSWGDDWKESTAIEVADRALARLDPGGILLLHDGFEPNPDEPAPRPTYDRIDMLTKVLDGIADRGLTAVTVSEVVAAGGGSTELWFDY